MGFITINRTKYPPCLYLLGLDNPDSVSYMTFIINAVAAGWLRSGDFIVMDNAILHSGRHADYLGFFLWNAPEIDGVPLRVVVVPFPTRSPELDPFELNWNTFVKWLKREVLMACLNVAGGSGAYDFLAGGVLSQFSHDDNLQNYIKCGYLGNINN